MLLLPRTQRLPARTQPRGKRKRLERAASAAGARPAHRRSGRRNPRTRRPAGRQCCTSPALRASSAVRTRPVASRSSAAAGPTARIRSVPPPQALETFSVACVKPMRACGAATRRSHASASSAPPPRATPFSAATVGTGNARIASSTVAPSAARASASSGSRTAASSARSPPAQNAISPAPAISARRRSACAACASKTTRSSRSASRESALRFPGRLIVTRSTPRS